MKLKKLFFLTAVIFLALPLLCQTELYENADVSDSACGYWISFDGKKPNGSWFLYIVNGTLQGDSIVVPGVSPDKCATPRFGRESYEGYPIQKPLSQIPIVCSPWIYGLTKESDGLWKNGYIIDPRGCARYKCKAIFHKSDGKKYLDDTLEIRGEIGMGIGKSIYWKRVTKEEAWNLK